MMCSGSWYWMADKFLQIVRSYAEMYWLYAGMCFVYSLKLIQLLTTEKALLVLLLLFACLFFYSLPFSGFVGYNSFYPTAMDKANHSVVSEFVFLRLSNRWGIQFCFFFFSMFYMACLMGNLLIVFMWLLTPTPMYFLLANLSLPDLWDCSIIAPKMIYDL